MMQELDRCSPSMMKVGKPNTVSAPTRAIHIIDGPYGTYFTENGPWQLMCEAANPPSRLERCELGTANFDYFESKFEKQTSF